MKRSAVLSRRPLTVMVARCLKSSISRREPDGDLAAAGADRQPVAVVDSGRDR